MVSKTNDFVFTALHIVAWVIFVGLCIEAGALLVNFIFTLFKPETLGYLYQKMDLTQVYHLNKGAFFGAYGFILLVSVLKAYLFYVVIELLQKLDLKKPFSPFAAEKIAKLSHYTFSIGIISIVGRELLNNLSDQGYEVAKLYKFLEDAQAFILMSAVIYIIANIFKKGIELQEENDLTV